MSKNLHRIALVAATAVALSAPLAPRALAASPPAIDAAGAQAIVDGIHALLVEMLGTFAPAASLLTATVQDDHYHIEIPITHAWKGGSIGGDSAGADLTPLGDGRWQIAKGTMPGRVEIDVDHPMPGAFTRSVTTVKDSSLSGVIDTTLATPSKLAIEEHGIASQSTGPNGTGDGTFANLSSAVTVSPAQNGRVTLVNTGTVDGYALSTHTDKGSFNFTARKFFGTGRVEGLSFPALRTAIHTLSTMATLPKPTPGQPTDPATAKALHSFIAALADSATAMTLEETGEGITFKGPEGTPVQVSIDHAGFDFEASDKGGETALALGWDVRGLSLPALPPGPATTFAPKRVLIHIAFSGLDSATLHKSLDEGVDEPTPGAAMGLIMAALAAHPATVAIDKLDIEAGPTTITGQGTLTTNGPTHTEGHAMLRATGVDAAIQALSSDPQAKGAVGMLIFLKGLSRPDGDGLVWNVTFDGQKLLVNGTDVSTLGGPKPQ